MLVSCFSFHWLFTPADVAGQLTLQHGISLHAVLVFDILPFPVPHDTGNTSTCSSVFDLVCAFFCITFYLYFDIWSCCLLLYISNTFNKSILSPNFSPESSPESRVQSRVQSPAFVISAIKYCVVFRQALSVTEVQYQTCRQRLWHFNIMTNTQQNIVCLRTQNSQLTLCCLNIYYLIAKKWSGPKPDQLDRFCPSPYILGLDI